MDLLLIYSTKSSVDKAILFILLSQSTTECLEHIEVSLILIIIVPMLMQMHLSFQLQIRKNLSKLQIISKRFILIVVILHSLDMVDTI